MAGQIIRALSRALFVVPVVLLLAACGASSVIGAQPTATATTQPLPSPTATALPTCASVLPGAAAINLQSQGFIYPMVFPTGTVGTAPQQTAGGTGLFSVYTFTACMPNTTTAGVSAFFASNLGTL